MSKEIQHLYKRNKNGNLVYQETTVIEVDNPDKTTIVHLEVLPDPLHTREEVLDSLVEVTKLGILPIWYAALQ